MKSRLNLILILVFFAACTGGVKRNVVAQSKTEKIKMEGFVVPEDQLNPPVIKLAKKPKIAIAGKPVIFQDRIQVKKIKDPFLSKVGTPVQCTPGQNGFSFPVQIPSKGITFFSSAPEIVVAQFPSSKDVNPNGFSAFGTIQGLKTNQIRCLLQDREGNLWFSSDDGVTRFDGKYLSHFIISNGVNKNNIVLSILEDRSGSLWFGTFGSGVIRFDGKSFIQYTEKEGLSNNIVNCVYQDKTGNFWMATSGGGVSKFDGKIFTNYTAKEGLAGNQVRTIFQDKAGMLWFGTFGNGISRYDGTSFFNYGAKEGFPATHLATIMEDKAGNLWFGSNNSGVIKYDGKNFYQYTDKQGLSNNSVLCMMQDDEDIFWLGTSGGGIFKFDGKSFNNYKEEDGLSTNYIRCSIIGRQGILWFGTRDGGLVKYNKNLFTHYTNNNGIGSNKIMNILQDETGNLWFASYGGGLTKYDGKKFAVYSLKESYLNDFQYTLLDGENGEIWFGSDGGGITKFDGNSYTQYTVNEGLCHNSVRCIIKDRKGAIWIGTYGGGVSRFDGKQFTNYSVKEGLSNGKILCLLEDKDGSIWFGTDGGGVTKYDGKKFFHFSEKEGLKNNSVNSILQDRNGDIWIGSTGGGITRFDGSLMTVYTKKEGLSNDVITSALQDHEGNLWFGSRNGPNILNIRQLNNKSDQQHPFMFKNYSYDDGFLGIGCNLGAIFEDKNGVIWIGSTNRLSAIRPKEDIPDTMPPKIRLTNIKLYNENIPWQKIDSNRDTTFVLGNGVEVGNFRFDSISKWYFLPEKLSLAFDNNFLTFSFIGIAQKQTQKMRYQYQLEGLEKYWSTPSDLTEVSYGNLMPGSYVFKVKAMNSEGYWSNEYQYSFSIRHPWWETWWFYSLVIIFVISLIFSYIKWREIEHENQKKLLNNIIEEQTHELKDKNLELETKNNDLQIANSEKDKFFSIIAHDVRGPLSTFLLFTEMMAENLHTYSMDEIQVMAESMNKSAASLFDLLENLLEWARMQRGLIPYSPEQLSLISVLNDSFETLLQPAKNKSIAMVVDVHSDLEVVADRNMLASIFRNLISNAIKFTPKGGKVTIKADKNKRNEIEICVSDNGIGMDEIMLQDLFRIDIYNNRKGTDGETSVGLGLLLCRDFVEKQGGRLWVESEVGLGSTFSFTLPTKLQG